MSGGLTLPPIPEALRADAVREPTKPLHAFILQRLALSPVTLTVIALCALLHYLSTVWGPDDWRPLVLAHMGERRWTAVLAGEIYQLLASTFLHRDLGHLRGNMQGLFAFGLLLEPIIGSRRTIITCLAAAVGGALTYLAASEDIRVIGSSSVVFGLAFVLIGWRLRLRDPPALGIDSASYRLLQVLSLLAGDYFLFTVLARSWPVYAPALIYAVWEELAGHVNIGHVGGAIAGLTLGLFAFAPQPTSSAGARRDRGLSVLASLAVATFAVSVIGALASGKPWELRDAPALETIPLPGTAFEVALPGLVLGNAEMKRTSDSDVQLRSVRYGHPRHSPVTFSIYVGGEEELGNEEYALLEMRTISTRELADNETRRTVTRVTVGGVPAVRTIQEHESLVTTSVSRKFAGLRVTVTGFRKKWAAQTSPPAWDGVEERIAASLRLAR